MSDGSMHAPEFPDDAIWLNTDHPPSLAELSQEETVVVMLFWSHSDLTSLILFSELKQFREDFGSTLSVVGVHSPVFDAESNRSIIEHAVARLDTSFPVLLDQDRQLKKQYGVSGTPTLLLLDPSGNIVGTLSGETQMEPLREAVSTVLERHEISTDGTSASPGVTDSSNDNFYPEGIAVSPDGTRVAVSEPSRHCIHLLDREGTKRQTIGGAQGDSAGTLDDAQFSFPRGLTYSEEGLYVCDTGNHRVKGVDFEEETVYHLLGNGQRGQEHDYSGPAQQTGLMAPYDIVKMENVLWITMAGGHQIWRYQILEEQLDSFLGTGAEGFQDGPHSQVTMAQPTGLAVHDESLYFLDSRSSSLRRYDPSEDWVETMIGKGMFQSGDVDGADEDGLMQFPVGLTATDNHLYVTDSFNHKVKRFDPEDGQLESWLGNGEPSDQLGEATGFFAPAGVASADDQLFVADTNNRRCLSVDRENWESANWLENTVG